MKTRLITNTLLLLSIIFTISFLSCSKHGPTGNTQTDETSLREAEQILFTQILNGSDSGKVVYELPTQMKAGSTVKAKGGDSTYTAQNDSWFFFINDFPGFRYFHPCRYVLVACSDGKYILINEGNEPENIDSMRVVIF
jgi:hypothetical protein